MGLGKMRGMERLGPRRGRGVDEMEGWMKDEGFTCGTRLNTRAAFGPETLEIRRCCQSVQRDWLKDHIGKNGVWIEIGEATKAIALCRSNSFSRDQRHDGMDKSQDRNRRVDGFICTCVSGFKM